VYYFFKTEFDMVSELFMKDSDKDCHNIYLFIWLRKKVVNKCEANGDC